MQSQNPWIGSLVIVAVGAGLGFGFNAVSSHPLPWIAKPKTAVSLESLGGAGSPIVSPDSLDSKEVTSPSSPDISISEGASVPTPVVSGTQSPGRPDADPEEARGSLSGGPARVAPAPVETVTPGPTPGRPPSGEAGVSVVANAYADIPESEYPIEIHLDKAKEFFDRGGLLVLDAREPEEFAEGHIAGALSAPADAVSGDLDWLDRMSKETRPILVYCGGGECELSLDLGFELNRAGHRRVLVLKEGYPEWKDAGYPTAEGAKP